MPHCCYEKQRLARRREPPELLQRWTLNGIVCFLCLSRVTEWSSPDDDATFTGCPLPSRLSVVCLVILYMRKMTSPVTKAMIEAYALMIMVMGTFFVYFCGMVWAFCNPKLSGAEEECEAGEQAAEHGEDCWVSAPDPPAVYFKSACAHLPASPHTTEGLTQSTYIKFCEDTDSLLSDCTAFCREDHGINNQIGESPSWNA